MLYDIHKNRPTKGARSFDYDGEELIAKCGEVKIHHWARRAKDPDTWHEPETEWHLDWKTHFPKNDTEQIVRVDGEEHRMDARTAIGGKRYVLEFQNSHISPEEVRQRDDGYPKAGYDGVIWVWNGEKANITVSHSNGGIYRATIGSRKYSIWQCRHAALIDCGAVVYQVVATPEYKNDYWYVQPCGRDEVLNTFTTGTFHPATSGLATVLTEGAV